MAKTSIQTALAAFLLLSIWIGSAIAKDEKPENPTPAMKLGIGWLWDLDEAKKLATNKKPLLCYLTTGGDLWCPISTNFERNILPDKRILEKLKNFATFMAVDTGFNTSPEACYELDVTYTPALAFIDENGELIRSFACDMRLTVDDYLERIDAVLAGGFPTREECGRRLIKNEYDEEALYYMALSDVETYRFANGSACLYTLLEEIEEPKLARGLRENAYLLYAECFTSYRVEAGIRDYDAAIEVLEMMLKEYPDSIHATDVNLRIGAAYEARSDPDEAEKAYARALDIATERATIFKASYSLARLREGKIETVEDLDAVSALYNKAWESRHDDVYFYYYYGNFAYKAEQFDKALAGYENLKRIYNRPITGLDDALVYCYAATRTKKRDKRSKVLLATRDLVKKLDEDCEDAESAIKLAYLCILTGDKLDRAKQLANKTAELLPDDYRPHDLLARLYLAEQDTAAAAVKAAKAIELAKADDELKIKHAVLMKRYAEILD